MAIRHACLALASCWIAITASAETRAVLVGVSGYPSLPPEWRLAGPRNDVRIVSEALRIRGVRDIRILADGVAGSRTLPTRAAILAALEGAIRDSRSGDWLIVYLSGHGAQQPQPGNAGGYREPDSLDELFLPYDVGPWDRGRSSVVNGIVDDELGAAFGDAAKRGISIWAIFDTCHAGDMIKALPTAESGRSTTWRGIPGRVLGIPPSAPGASKTFGRLAPLPRQDKGSAAAGGGVQVAYYATQPDEPAPEEALLPGSGDAAKAGVFTHHLTSVLRDPAAGDFNTLMVRIRDRYRQERRPFPSPSIEGNGKLPLPF